MKRSHFVARFLVIFLIFSNAVSVLSLSWTSSVVEGLANSSFTDILTFKMSKFGKEANHVNDLAKQLSKSSLTTTYDFLHVLKSESTKNHIETQWWQIKDQNYLLIVVFLKFNAFGHYLGQFLNWYDQETKQKRAKILTVVFEDKRPNTKLYGQALTAAWKRYKILDFTIVRVNLKKNFQEVVFFDPFQIRFQSGPLSVFNNLFPYKLKNIHGYVIRYDGRIARANRKEYERVAKKTSRKFELASYDFFDNYLAPAINATIITGVRSNSDIYSSGPINLLCTDSESVLVICSRVIRYEEAGIIHPVIYEESVLSLTSEYALLSSTLFIAIPAFMLIAKVFGFPRDTWNAFEIFKALLGIDAPQVHSLPECAIYYCMFILSFTILSDLILSVNNIKLTFTEKSFDTWEKIRDSNLKIFIHSGDFYLYDVEGFYASEFLRNLTKHTKAGKIRDCYSNLWRRDRICIGSIDKYYFNKHINLEKLQIKGNSSVEIERLLSDRNMMVSPLEHKYTLIAQMFAQGSFLIDIYNKYSTRAVENGLDFTLRSFERMLKNQMNRGYQEDEIASGLTTPSLILVGLVGLSLASAVFCFEILHEIIEAYLRRLYCWVRKLFRLSMKRIRQEIRRCAGVIDTENV